MLKRIFLFISTNIAIMILVWLIIFALERYAWIKISPDLRSWVIPLMVFSLIYWFAWALISLGISRWIAKKIYSIELIEEQTIFSYPKDVQFAFFKVKEFSLSAGIKMPEFWIYESPDPNAFATWPSRNKSLVAISTWLLETMNQSEIEWVIAHEMAHVVNWDMVTMTLVQWVINSFVIFLARVIAFFIDRFISKDEEESNSLAYYWIVIFLDIVLSILASLIVMAYSRRREFSADYDATKFTPKVNMINALKKLKTLSDRNEVHWSQELETLKISSRGAIISLFSSHPDLDDRINRLSNSI